MKTELRKVKRDIQAIYINSLGCFFLSSSSLSFYTLVEYNMYYYIYDQILCVFHRLSAKHNDDDDDSVLVS